MDSNSKFKKVINFLDKHNISYEYDTNLNLIFVSIGQLKVPFIKLSWWLREKFMFGINGNLNIDLGVSSNNKHDQTLQLNNLDFDNKDYITVLDFVVHCYSNKYSGTSTKYKIQVEEPCVWLDGPLLVSTDENGTNNYILVCSD